MQVYYIWRVLFWRIQGASRNSHNKVLAKIKHSTVYGTRPPPSGKVIHSALQVLLSAAWPLYPNDKYYSSIPNTPDKKYHSIPTHLCRNENMDIKWEKLTFVVIFMTTLLDLGKFRISRLKICKTKHQSTWKNTFHVLL